MKKMWFIFLLTSCSIGVCGQTAKVIALTPDEAKVAKNWDEVVDRAVAQRKAFYESLQHKYTQTVKMECPDLTWYSGTTGNIMTIEPDGILRDTGQKHDPSKESFKVPCKKEAVYRNKPGWDDGFQYSEDYKYIVPVEPKYAPYRGGLNNIYPWGGSFVTY